MNYFYLVGYDKRSDSFSRPQERLEDREKALAKAKASGLQVLTAAEYREFTGRDAARDLRAEELSALDTES